ncbi:MAG: MBL fold metallo-hydrolase [Gemmatimonadota bacterium]|nr:MBL fold metallo-hydrolase [Gemmatimonadota bacterium]
MKIRRHATLAAVLTVFACGDDEAEAPAGDGPGSDAAVESPYAPEAPDSVYRVVREITDGVYTYEYARPEDPVTTVSMFVVSEEGVLVADGQGNIEETERLIDEIREVSDAPITHLVIATDHGDHTGGNLAFPESVEAYAHPAVAEALEPAEPGDPVLEPDHLVRDRERIVLGNREIEVLFLGRGHTAGDLVVHLPEEGIAFMSEAYLDRVFPLMITAYPSEWVETLHLAEALDARTYVAGHGVRGSIQYGKEDLVRYRRAVEQVIAEVTRLYEAGMTVDEAVERANFGELAQQADYVYQAERAVRRVWAELEGELD